jgi:5-methyltetrahydropteroyltriglutamate--homocysteine methyltransferase
MQRSEARILTTHTGSLPRPAPLTELYARRAKGEAVDEKQIDTAGRDALHWIVPRQVEAGIDVINNGEQQRESFVLYLRHRLTGLGGKGTRFPWADVDQYPEFKAALQAQADVKTAVSNRDFIPKALGRVTYRDPSLIEAECMDFKAALGELPAPPAEAFFAAPSPGIVASIVQNDFYDSDAAYFDALGETLRVEYEAIVKHGYVLQIDAPDFGLERHSSFRYRPLSEFLDFVALGVETINKALENIPPDRVRLHACWGNYEGPHDWDVPLSDILPVILRAKVGALVLPFANPRHAHEFRCFETKPLAENQILVAGVIDTLTNFVEHPEVVADRIERIARVLGDPRRVMAGTDCGFDTAAGMGRVARDVVWAKMKALSDGARIASGRLFS